MASPTNTPPRRSSPHRLVPTALWRGVAAAAFGLLATTAQAAIVLAPQYAGSFGTGSGASATFLQIDGSWRGSTVLWDEDSRTYGSGASIGSFAWGTGLWGRADFDTLQHAHRTAGCSGLLVGCWTGPAPTINFGNGAYNAAYDTTWGAAQPLPESLGDANWTAHFSGFIRIAKAGDYNFSVLHDDGFFFRLVGAAGAALEIGRDFLNPRDRIGFADDLTLSEGLYGFELGMWNRLEAGVVDLRWMLPGRERWTLVPTEHLLPARAVPAPGTAVLALFGVAALASTRRRRDAARRMPS